MKTNDLLRPLRPRRGLHVLGLLLVAGMTSAACAEDPPLTIKYRLTPGPAQACSTTTCEDIEVACDAVLSIRIFDPQQPSKPFASICERIASPRTLCGMKSVRLPADLRLPVRRLALQVALFNADDIPEAEGRRICPQNIPFDANGLPAPNVYQPAVAGQAYYTPGESETVVELGCTDLSVVNTATCTNDDRVRVTASVADFDTLQPVSDAVAEKVLLNAGEPVSRLNPVTGDVEFHIPANASRTLDRIPETIRPAWFGNVSLRFVQTACVEVLEDEAQTTKAVTCKEVSVDDSEIDLPAVRLARQTLDGVLMALGKPSFPEEGLVVGKVIDRLGNPVKDVVVRPSSGTVQYLSAARDSFAGGATSETGIFISRDAGYRTSWTAAGTAGGYGGLVSGRVTIVLLQPTASDL